MGEREEERQVFMNFNESSVVGTTKATHPGLLHAPEEIAMVTLRYLSVEPNKTKEM